MDPDGQVFEKINTDDNTKGDFFFPPTRKKNEIPICFIFFSYPYLRLSPFWCTLMIITSCSFRILESAAVMGSVTDIVSTESDSKEEVAKEPKENG